jgi:hypothetical protein
VLAHRQTYTSADEGQALGIDADEVLKPLAMQHRLVPVAAPD